MDYLFNKWGKVKELLKDKYIFLFLDYDGTLTAIVETPEKVITAKQTKTLLEKLSKNPGFKIAIISGRALSDIRDRVGLKNIIYVGNHGLEIEGPKIKFDPSILLYFDRLSIRPERAKRVEGLRVNPERSRRIENPISLRYKTILKHIKDDLSIRLSAIKGAFVEDKGLTLSVHYRLVDKKQIPQVKTIFHEATILYLIRNKIKIKSGKMVLEIRPPAKWDKGKAVLWLLARQQFALKNKAIFPIYTGDDVTDEDVFKVLRDRGLTIFVGKPRASHAQYYLKNTKEVIEFMRQLLQLSID